MIALVVLASLLSASIAEDIARAHELVGRLACEEALPLAEAITKSETADQAQRREGLLIAGYCLAAGGRVGDAEELFRAAVQEDVRLEPGFVMERRVQYLLDAARAQVLEERRRGALDRRAALGRGVELRVTAPEQITGGQRASFEVLVTGLEAERVRSVKLEFRRPEDLEFYSLPIRRVTQTLWRGEIGGIYTASTSPYQLRWIVTAPDEEGPLASFGRRDRPEILPVTAGSQVAEDLRARERLPPVTRLLFAGLGAPVATTLAAVSTFAFAFAADAADVTLSGNAEGPRVIGMLVLATTPAVMLAAELATTLYLLDGAFAYVPAGVVAAVTFVADVALVVALFRGASVLSLASDTKYGLESSIGVGAVVLACATSGVVPAALVGWDLSHEAE